MQKRLDKFENAVSLFGIAVSRDQNITVACISLASLTAEKPNWKLENVARKIWKIYMKLEMLAHI